MELCSLTDAFPDIQKPNSPSKEERRAARKKAKKCKGADLQYLKGQDDLLPPAADTLKKLGELPAYTSYDDAFNDLSGSTIEGFKLPRLPASNTLFTDQGLPEYFGKGIDDDDSSGKKEGFANMQTNNGEEFEYLFGGNGAEKAGSNSSTLPDPMLSDLWKPLTTAKTKTAFFQGQQGNGRVVERVDNKQKYVEYEERQRIPVSYKTKQDEPDSMRNLMANQLKDLQRRMDEMTLKQPRDSKNEILIFVGTGVFLLLSFDLMIRAAGR
jgi:hypothetical protein